MAKKKTPAKKTTKKSNRGGRRPGAGAPRALSRTREAQALLWYRMLWKKAQSATEVRPWGVREDILNQVTARIAKAFKVRVSTETVKRWLKEDRRRTKAAGRKKK